MTSPDVFPIAVCSWSLEPESIDDLIVKMQACEIDHVQLALVPLLEEPLKWARSNEKLREAGIRIVSGMMGCVGEDYSTIERIKQTGGIMPDDTYPATLARMHRAAPLARELSLSLITFHAGFIPHQPGDPAFTKGLHRVAEVAKVFAQVGIEVALETGQEPVDALLELLAALNLPNIGVNFDPANMLLYGSGDPIAALEKLEPYVRQLHIKDAVASLTPGEWGQEVPAGTGQVDWERFFDLTGKNGKAFVIEREAGTSRVADIVRARNLVMHALGHQT